MLRLQLLDCGDDGERRLRPGRPRREVLIAVMLTGLVYALTYSAIRGELKILAYGVLLEIYQLVSLRRSKATIAPGPGGAGSLDEETRSTSSSSSALVYAPVVALGVLIGGVVWFLA